MKHAAPFLLATLALLGTAINADDNPTAKAAEPNADKIVDEWAFPHGTGGGIQTIGISNGPIQTSILDTKKSFGEVWSFYAKKFGSDKKYSEKEAYYHHGKTKDGRYFIRDFIKADEPRRTFFVYTCRRFTVTAIVKPKGDGTIVDMTVVAHE